MQPEWTKLLQPLLAPLNPRQQLLAGQCHGFIFETSGGRVGIIEEIRYHSTAERPDYLVVCAGRIGRRLDTRRGFLVPAPTAIARQRTPSPRPQL